MDLGAMLAGKRVLVTGASSGLGENFARLATGLPASPIPFAPRRCQAHQEPCRVRRSR